MHLFIYLPAYLPLFAYFPISLFTYLPIHLLIRTPLGRDGVQQSSQGEQRLAEEGKGAANERAACAPSVPQVPPEDAQDEAAQDSPDRAGVGACQAPFAGQR